MRRIAVRWSLIVATATCLVDVAVAQPVQADSQQIAQPLHVETRFAPPLGAVQRFRLTITKRGQTHSWIEEVRFERAGDAYIAHWRMDPASLPPGMKHPMLAPMIRPFTGTPLAFDLDEAGDIVSVRDWPTQQARLLKGVEELRPLLLAASKGDARQADTIVTATRALFAQLDAQSGGAVILKNLDPVFGWGGYELELGEPISATETVEIALFGTSVDRRSTVTLVALDPGIARITLRSEFDGAALRATMERMRAMVDNGDPAGNGRFDRAMAQLDQVRAVQSATVTLDLATGLPRRVEAEVSADGKSDRTVIEWLKR